MLHMHTVECTKATQNYWQCYDRLCSSYLNIETQSIQEIQVTTAVIPTPLSLVCTMSHHSATNIGGDMEMLTITKGYTNGYYNVGLYYLASTWGCRNTLCYNVGLYVSSTWGFDYTNFNVGLYSNRGRNTLRHRGACLTPYQRGVVWTNRRHQRGAFLNYGRTSARSG